MPEGKESEINMHAKKFWCWICGSNPQGIGTLLVGIAAFIALYQTSTVLEKILLVQKQAEQIGSAVTELKDQSKQIALAIDLLGSQLKEMKAAQAIDSSPALQSTNPTKEQIKEAIKNIPTKPSGKRSSIYLPTDRIENTVELIYKEKTPSARAAILQNSLEYKASGYLLDENGDSLRGEDGNKLNFKINTDKQKKRK